MRKRRRTCTTIYLGSNDKRFEYVTDGNVKLADSVTIERWVVRLMACTKAWMRLDADGMRTIHGTRIEGLLNIELQWLAELTKARTIESEAFSVDDDDDDDEFRDMWRRGGEGFGERRGVRGTGRYAGEYRRRRR